MNLQRAVDHAKLNGIKPKTITTKDQLNKMPGDWKMGDQYFVFDLHNRLEYVKAE